MDPKLVLTLSFGRIGHGTFHVKLLRVHFSGSYKLIPGFSQTRTATSAIEVIKTEHRTSALTPSHRLVAATIENA